MHDSVTVINKLYKYSEAKMKPRRLFIIVCLLKQKTPKEQLVLMTSI